MPSLERITTVRGYYCFTTLSRKSWFGVSCRLCWIRARPDLIFTVERMVCRWTCPPTQTRSSTASMASSKVAATLTFRSYFSLETRAHRKPDGYSEGSGGPGH